MNEYREDRTKRMNITHRESGMLRIVSNIRRLLLNDRYARSKLNFREWVLCGTWMKFVVDRSWQNISDRWVNSFIISAWLCNNKKLHLKEVSFYVIHLNLSEKRRKPSYVVNISLSILSRKLRSRATRKFSIPFRAQFSLSRFNPSV